MKNIRLALIFGSYAKDIPKEHSDIDVYIETADQRIKKQLEEAHSTLSVKIGKYNSDNYLVKEIQKNHIIIKGLEEYYDKQRFFV